MQEESGAVGLPSIAEATSSSGVSSVGDNDDNSHDDTTIGVQSKANKSCCGNYCSVLDHGECCEHSSAEYESYCLLCQSRLETGRQKQLYGQRVMARKLVEEVMDKEEDVTTATRDEAGDCPICLDTATDPCELCCGHTVCIGHMEKLSDCPLCRHPIGGAREKEDDELSILELMALRDEPHPLALLAEARRNTTDDPRAFNTRYRYLVSRLNRRGRTLLGHQSPLRTSVPNHEWDLS